ncbi:MAG: DUF3592 domain-containing protein [Terracidiphilus sp.]|jgi:hypothetical protein
MTMAVAPQNLPKGRRPAVVLAGFFCLFTGLCTVFMLIVTPALAWQDRVHAQWPQATAQVQQCGLDPYPPDPKYYRIDCSVSYTVHGEKILSHVDSRTTLDPRQVIWESQPPQFERMQEWVDAHPKGTPIAVHYDPASRSKAILIVTDMPSGGSQTPFCLRLLEISAMSCVLLLAIVRIIRPRSIAVNEGS